jgi:TolB-like protein
MGDDERSTVATLREYRELFRFHIEANDGRVVDMAGDSVMAVFDATAGAVTAAMAIQVALGERNETLPAERQMNFRIGVNLGDIQEAEDGTIYGDGVNIAARLEGLSEPGGVMISGKVHEEIEGKFDYGFADAGSHEVKNIERPVRAYQFVGDHGRTRRRPVRASRKWLAAAIGGGIITLAVGFVISSVMEDTPSGTRAWPVIAVPPMTPSSESNEDLEFANGLSGAITTALSKFNRLVTNKGKDASIADYIVEGRVQRGQDRIRLAVQLLDVDDGSQIWAETFDHELSAGGNFALQDELGARVAAALGNELGPIWIAELTTFKRRPVAEYSPTDGYILTLVFYQSFSPEDHASATDCLEASVKRNPDQSLVWLDLALMIFHEYSYGFNIRPDPLESSLEAVQRAKKLNASDYYVYYILAKIQHARQVRLDTFHALSEQAIRLNPYDTEMLADIGTWMAYAGEWERGRDLIERSMRLNPSHASWMHFPLFLDLYNQGAYREALVEAQKINLPQNYMAQGGLAAVHGRLGETQNAIAAYERAVSVHPAFASDPREPYRKRRMPTTLIEALMDGMRKAGINIPEYAEGAGETVE